LIYSSLLVAQVKLVKPENNTENLSLRPTFIWSKDKDASYYELQISENPDFRPSKGSLNPEWPKTKDTIYTLTKSLKNNTTYYWAVTAFISPDNPKPRSQTGSFKTAKFIAPELILSKREFLADINGQLDFVTFTSDSLFAFVIHEENSSKLYVFNSKTKDLFQIKSYIEESISTDELFKQPKIDEVFYESNLVWCPQKINNRQWFLFIGAGKQKNHDLYLGCVGTNSVIRLTNHLAMDYMPNWSPDGNKIVFVSNRTGNGDIYLINNVKNIFSKYSDVIFAKLDTIFEEFVDLNLSHKSSEEKVDFIRLTSNPFEDFYPSFSPDGKFITFSENRLIEGANNFGISIIDLEQYNNDDIIRLPKISNNLIETRSTWSPNGKYLAFYTMQDNTSNYASIYACIFDNQMINPNYFKIADSVRIQEHIGPMFSSENTIVFSKYNKLLNTYEIQEINISKLGRQSEVLYSQNSFIGSINVVSGAIQAILQLEDDFYLSNFWYNQSFEKPVNFWTGKISPCSGFLSFITCDKRIEYGSIGAAGLIVSILIYNIFSKEDDQTEIIKGFGIPPSPPSGNSK